MSQKYINFPIQEILNLKGMVVDSIDFLKENKIITVHLKRDLRFIMGLLPNTVLSINFHNLCLKRYSATDPLEE